jgi:hypothetical protein
VPEIVDDGVTGFIVSSQEKAIAAAAGWTASTGARAARPSSGASARP